MNVCGFAPDASLIMPITVFVRLERDDAIIPHAETLLAAREVNVLRRQAHQSSVNSACLIPFDRATAERAGAIVHTPHHANTESLRRAVRLPARDGFNVVHTLKTQTSFSDFIRLKGTCDR